MSTAHRVVLGSEVPLQLEAWCRELPRLLSQVPPDAVIHRARNTLVRLDAPGLGAVVVKRFPRATRLRASKAERSFAIAGELLARGIPTPQPLAWLRWNGGSAYVCRAVDGARQLHHWLRSDGTDWRAALRAAGIAAGRAHRAGAVHHDLSPGNLIVGDTPADPAAWLLIDLNRLRFATVADACSGTRWLARLQAKDPRRGAAFLAGYAHAWDADPARVTRCYRSERERWVRTNRLRQRSRGLRRRLAKGLRQ